MNKTSISHDDVIAVLRVISIISDRIACWMQMAEKEKEVATHDKEE